MPTQPEVDVDVDVDVNHVILHQPELVDRAFCGSENGGYYKYRSRIDINKFYCILGNVASGLSCAWSNINESVSPSDDPPLNYLVTTKPQIHQL